MLFQSIEVCTLSKQSNIFFINVESWTEITSFYSDKHLQKDQFFIHLGLLIFQRQNYIDLYFLVYNLQAFYWLKFNSIILNFTIFIRFCQDFIHFVLFAVTFVFTCNRVFNSPINSIDSKQFIIISTGLSNGRKGINTKINQKDKTKSIPLASFMAQVCQASYRWRQPEYQLLPLYLAAKNFQMVQNYIIIIKLLFGSF
ncbi:Hypothetical_protein [Hexamita inflata]|uniref:Hypothetical_protein n=1 Tax=Hexamita inflata TaxID=28002 RepID=A0AA86TUS1_9EUKA|nr:Hypothetical protein HINF_LOCUS10038 [Hexamita inflata]